MEIAATGLAARTTNTPPETFPPENRTLARAVRVLNQAGAAGPAREFTFTVDPITKKPVIRIVNADTHELIEQIPSEYILEVAQDLGKNIQSSSASTDKTF